MAPIREYGTMMHSRKLVEGGHGIPSANCQRGDDANGCQPQYRSTASDEVYVGLPRTY